MFCFLQQCVFMLEFVREGLGGHAVWEGVLGRKAPCESHCHSPCHPAPCGQSTRASPGSGSCVTVTDGPLNSHLGVLHGGCPLQGVCTQPGEWGCSAQLPAEVAVPGAGSRMICGCPVLASKRGQGTRHLLCAQMQTILNLETI